MNSDLQADIVVANILAGPLAHLAPTISTLVKTGASKLALSGILAKPREKSLSVPRRFTIESITEREEWFYCWHQNAITLHSF